MKLTAPALLLIALVSCSSGGKKNATPPAASDGNMYSRLLKPQDMSKRSEFDRARDNTTGRKSGIAGFFQRQSVKGDSYAGKKSFNSGKGFKTEGFSQADLQSRSFAGRSKAEGSRYNQAGESAREGSQVFGTEASRYDNQAARQQGDAFSQSDDRFGTSAVRDASKSQQKNVRPKIIQTYQQEGKSSYKEEDVKRMVNRN